MKNKPSLKPPLLAHFSTPRHFYLFDAPTNEILQVSQALWTASQDPNFWDFARHAPQASDAMQQQRRFPAIQPSDYSAIAQAREEINALGASRPTQLRLFADAAQYRAELETSIGHLILNITDQCNFRCAYCVYSGHYQDRRQHGNYTMSADTARAAVDLFLQHNRNAEFTNIGFYGGEPTTHFAVIEETVAHVERVRDREVRYGVTTNGYELSDAMLDFLIRHRFNILVSLDGPVDTHDRFRKTAGGKQTFARVYRTLERLREKDEDFFKIKVGLSIVAAPPYNMKALKTFFDADPLLKNVRKSITQVSAEETGFFDSAEAVAARRIGAPEDSGLDAMRAEYKRNLVAGDPEKSPFLAALFQNDVADLHNRTLYPQGYVGAIYPNGLCKPGIRKLFISHDGQAHICERVNTTLAIGDIVNGIDFEKASKLLNDYLDQSNARCLDCFANRHCSACFATSFSSDGFRHAEKQALCTNIRNKLTATLADYCEVLEVNPRAFDFTENFYSE